MTAPTTAFRVEHVGSFVRPERLLDAARANKAGKLDDAQFKTIQDGCIRDIVAFQESNGCIRDKPASMAVGIHLCRGNLKGAWMAEGGYEPVADARFNRLNATTYCLEYDTERAGDFSPLRFVPRGKRVILGLVSTKTPVLEAKDLLKRRIDAAAKHVPLEQLGIGPQCGFSSGGGGGQTVTQDDTRRKLELIMQTANEVWGTT